MDGVDDVREQLIAEAKAYWRHKRAADAHLKKIRALFFVAHDKGIGPAELERLTDRAYVKETISRQLNRSAVPEQS